MRLRHLAHGLLVALVAPGPLSCGKDDGSITPARKFRMLLHTNPTRERGECLGTRAGASEDM